MAQKAKQQKLTFWVSKSPVATEGSASGYVDSGSPSAQSTEHFPPINSADSSAPRSSVEVGCSGSSSIPSGNSTLPPEAAVSLEPESPNATEAPPHTNDIGVYIGRQR